MAAWAMAMAMATGNSSTATAMGLHQFQLWAKVARCQNGFYRCKIHFSTIRKLNLPFLFIWASRHDSNIGSATRRFFYPCVCVWVYLSCVRRRLFCCCFHSLLNNNHRTIDEFNTVSVENWDFDFDFLDLTSFNELVFFPFKWNWLKRWIIHWYWLWFQTVMLVFDFFFFSFAVSLRFYSFLISTIALFHFSFRQTLFVCSGTHWANGLRF